MAVWLMMLPCRRSRRPARNRHAAEGCAALWAEAEQEIARAVAVGNLAPAKP